MSANLLVKDRVAGKYANHVNGEGINFFGCAIIASTLSAMIMMAGPHTSASLNPAVSISQTLLELGPLKEQVADAIFWNVYMAGPFTGALLAGFASWGHSFVLAKAEKAKADKAAKAKEDEKKSADNEAGKAAGKGKDDTDKLIQEEPKDKKA